jgi:NifB/MoaA-like Fe-S oxidoreductase
MMLDELEGMQKEYRARLGINFAYPTDEWYLVAGKAIPPVEAYDDQKLQENGLGMVSEFLEEWEALRDEIGANTIDSGGKTYASRFVSTPAVTLVTGTLFAETLSAIGLEFGELTGIEVSVQGVENRVLGRTITVAGLLNAVDIIEHLAETGYGSLVILPVKAFDHPDRISLDDYTPQQVADRLQVNVALAESMGDVWDALTGTSSLFYTPSG